MASKVSITYRWFENAQCWDSVVRHRTFRSQAAFARWYSANHSRVEITESDGRTAGDIRFNMYVRNAR